MSAVELRESACSACGVIEVQAAFCTSCGHRHDEVALTVTETDRLTVLESVIERGVQTFVEVGEALLEIRDGRLYRASHPTFEAYCQSRWGWTRQRAHQLIDGARVVAALSTTVDDVPANEAQARELAPLAAEPEKMRAAWTEANRRTGGKPTAATVAQVVRETKHETIERETERERTTSDPPSAPPPSGSEWADLMAAIRAIRDLSATSPTSVAVAVPEHRRAGTARTLRQLGTYLGAIALSLEEMG